ncbi:MAG: beta-Ig-H3/fasciclin [Methanolobus sp. T82-4]|jgi:uncharacterized surface protein with fasciclin (FAS1) repeats|nr:MAG: beta-Ig-H3/fasciclin [Methanolobus sp. T82-4]
MRKQLLILFVVMLAVFAAIGCTDTEDQPTTEENITGDEEEITGAEEDIEENVSDAEEEMTDSEDEEMNIVETAIDAGSFDTLVLALETTGLDATLSEEGPYTVFAPTDDAFEELPEGTLDALMEDEEQLSEVLTYHVVSGEYMASDLTDGTTLETVQGEMITINVTDDNVMVDDANVVQPDIVASNGVIHVIDAVILPPSMAEEDMMGNDSMDNETMDSENGDVVVVPVD